jgi:hypothetical protein
MCLFQDRMRMQAFFIDRAIAKYKDPHQIQPLGQKAYKSNGVQLIKAPLASIHLPLQQWLSHGEV